MRCTDAAKVVVDDTVVGGADIGVEGGAGVDVAAATTAKPPEYSITHKSIFNRC